MDWTTIGIIYYVVGFTLSCLYCYFEYDKVTFKDLFMSFLMGLVTPLIVGILITGGIKKLSDMEVWDKVLIRR